MDKTLWTASLFLVILGFLLLIAGALCRVYVNYKEPRRGRVTARVVDLLLQEPVSQDQIRIYKNCYYPVFEFYAEGKLYKITHPEGCPATLLYTKYDGFVNEFSKKKKLNFILSAQMRETSAVNFSVLLIQYN